MKKLFLTGLISLTLLSACGSSGDSSDPVVDKKAATCLAIVCVTQGLVPENNMIGNHVDTSFNLYSGKITDCTGVHSYTAYQFNCSDVDTSLADCPEGEPSKTVVDCSN